MEFEKFKTRKKTGFICLGVGAGIGFTAFIIDAIKTSNEDCTFLCGPIVGFAILINVTAVGGLVCIPFSISAKRNLKNSIRIYNGEKLGEVFPKKNTPTMKIGLSPSNGGIGLVVSF